MNLAMKEQAKSRNSTTPSTRDSDVSYSSVATSVLSTASSTTRKRNSNKETSSIKLLQKHDCDITLSFD